MTSSKNTLKNNSLRVKVPIKTSINRYLVVFHSDLLIFFVWYVGRISVYHTSILWRKENRKSSTNLNGLGIRMVQVAHSQMHMPPLWNCCCALGQYGRDMKQS